MYAATKETQYSHCYFDKGMPFQNNDDMPTYVRVNPKARRLRSDRDRWKILKNVQPVVNDVEVKFNKLATKWKDETGLYSTTQQKVYNRSYMAIISMGKEVVPFILKDIKNGGPWHWHTALSIINDYFPVPLEETNPKKIKQAWLEWGGSQNLI